MTGTSVHRLDAINGREPRTAHVLIVGGGASGVLMAVHLLRGDPGRQVTLIERRSLLGCGVAYSTNDPDHLLNTRVENMSAFADEPGHFREWLQANGAEAADGSFVRRDVYGRYMAGLLDPWRGGAQLNCVRNECVDLIEDETGVQALLADGTVLSADLAILATGHPQPPPCPDRVIAAPWTTTSAPDPAARVLIVGSGLTMVDQVLTLLRRGHRGEIVALSRRGLLPRPHRPTRPMPLASDELPRDRSISHILRWLRDRAAEAEAGGGDWRDVVDGLRPHVQRIWTELPLPERRRFLRHAATWWDVHRHRMPQETHARIADALERGQLRILRGTLAGTTLTDAGLIAEIALRREDASERLLVGHVVDCRGLRRDPAEDRTPPIGALLAAGKASVDPLRIGIRVDPDCRVIDAQGRASARILAIGPVTRAAFWEITAIPDIRLQVARVAAGLARGPGGRTGPGSPRAASDRTA